MCIRDRYMGEKFYALSQSKLEDWLRLSTESEMMAFASNIDSGFQREDGLQLFLTFSADIAIRHSLISIPKGTNRVMVSDQPDYTYIDGFCRLLVFCQRALEPRYKKQDVIDWSMQAILLVLTKHHEAGLETFNQRPFYRLFLNLLSQLKNLRGSPFFSEADTIAVIQFLVKVFDRTQPIFYPGFAYAWFELVAHKYFMPEILINQGGWEFMFHLLINVFRFLRLLQENDRTPANNSSIKLFYTGTLRVMLVLLHDFPEFLATYSFLLLEEIGNSFPQIRNLILSSFPKSVRPAHPLTFQLKDYPDAELPELLPVILERVQANSLWTWIDAYVKNHQEEILQHIYTRFFGGEQEPSDYLNAPLVSLFINCIPHWVYLVPQGDVSHDIKQVRERCVESYNFLRKLLFMSSYEVREVILTAMVNEARYPNRKTLYFITFFIQLFQSGAQERDRASEAIMEQLLRMIVEILLIKEPYPWGVLCTFVELQRNPLCAIGSRPFLQEHVNIFEMINQKIFNTPRLNDVNEGNISNE
eukprot:TRINITY_DN1609_c0_g3_i1.p1 TRINITY_DN1609_c0_g3~~TRINITY_DN1609_c0_g3_i1.p1  ORF type:complete len:550 (-),score=170.29 TRINITY_DN1609_c0_g3_i1:118-1707(-)